MGTPVRVRNNTKAWFNGPPSSCCELTGEATNEKPLPGYEVVVAIPGEGHLSFRWDELEVL